MAVEVRILEEGSLDHKDPQVEIRHSWHGGMDAATINVLQFVNSRNFRNYRELKIKISSNLNT